jgi:hypothetical protein
MTASADRDQQRVGPASTYAMTGRTGTELIAAEALVEALRPLVAAIVAEELKLRFDERMLHESSPRWLTLEQAAARLGCSPDAARMRARRGRLEYRYQGRRMYVSADSVDRLG